MLVGKAIVCCKFVFAEERKNLFPISLIGTTIQDGSSRERKDDIILDPNPNKEKQK